MEEGGKDVPVTWRTTAGNGRWRRRHARATGDTPPRPAPTLPLFSAAAAEGLPPLSFLPRQHAPRRLLGGGAVGPSSQEEERKARLPPQPHHRPAPRGRPQERPRNRPHTHRPRGCSPRDSLAPPRHDNDAHHHPSPPSPARAPSRPRCVTPPLAPLSSPSRNGQAAQRKRHPPPTAAGLSGWGHPHEGQRIILIR